MLEQEQQRARNGADAQGYRSRMLLALALLLTALVVMLVRDRTYWFGGDEMQAEGESIGTPESRAAPVPNPATPAATAKPAQAARNRKSETAKHAEKALSEGTSVVATDRGVLPPLEVEVVNGKTRHTIQSGPSAVKVDTVGEAGASSPAPVTTALQRERIDSGALQPSYPSLSGQMKVQGSVLLQAFIGVDGLIRELRVISGPAILSSAAREAAMQWRFKPYLQNGKPVETQARITVNFVIKVWDDQVRDQATGKTSTPARTAGAPPPPPPPQKNKKKKIKNL